MPKMAEKNILSLILENRKALIYYIIINLWKFIGHVWQVSVTLL